MKKIWQSPSSDPSTESEEASNQDSCMPKEHVTDGSKSATEVESKSLSKDELLLVHLLHLACSLKGLPVNAFSEMLIELKNLGLLSDWARELAVMIPSEFKDVFDSTFEHHKAGTRFPTFWNSSGKIEPSSRFQRDFTVLHFLGKGGFGSVVLAINKLDGCEYAVKKVRLSSNVGKNEKILREAKILAKLYNQRIVRYYQAWTEFVYLCNKKEPEPDENVSGSGGSSSDESFSGADSTNGGEVTFMYIQMEYCQALYATILIRLMLRLRRNLHLKLFAKLLKGSNICMTKELFTVI